MKTTKILLATLALAASTIFAHEAAEPRPAESRTAILVCKLIEENHISHVRINDEISVNLTFSGPANAFPTVPEGKARIRLILTSEHTRAQLDRALETLTRVARRMNLM